MSATDFSFEPFFRTGGLLCFMSGCAQHRPGLARDVVRRGAPRRGIAQLALETSPRTGCCSCLPERADADIAPLPCRSADPGDDRHAQLRGASHPCALCTAAWLIAWYGTHLAGFYNWALESGWALNLAHAILIAGGLLFWWPLASGRLSTAAVLAYLGAGFVASSFLGLALIFSSRPFYSFYVHAPRLWGLSPARDQNLGGILMNAEQTLVFLIVIGWYVWRLLEEEHVSGAGESPAAH